MKFRMKKITALMTAAVLGASTFGGVSVMAAESTEAMAVPADEAGMVVDGDAVAADGDAIPSDFIQGTFKPSDTTVQAQDSYEYPFLGLNMKLPEELLKQIKAQSIAMITNEGWIRRKNWIRSPAVPSTKKLEAAVTESISII